MEHRAFDYKSKTDFWADSVCLEHSLPFQDDLEILRSPVMLNDREVRNRFCAQPIEGGDACDDGAPSEHTMGRYEELAKGGSGIIWMESTAVSEEGKSVPHQLWIRDETVDAFERLVAHIHQKSDPFTVLQLTHSGRNSNPDGRHLAVCAYENARLFRQNYRIISDDELDRLLEDYVHAAIFAKKAGFNAVDIRACHGYLLHELLSAYERTGKYGGTFENRTRLLYDIIREVKKETNLTIAVRLNVTDGLEYPNGWGTKPVGEYDLDLTEPIRVAKDLGDLGVSVLNISAGIGEVTPYMIRPYDRGIIPNEHPLEGISRLLYSAKVIREAVPSVRVVGSGFTWLREYAANVAAGGINDGWFDFAGFGRQWITDPSYANEILAQGRPERLCTTCGACMGLLKSGRQMQCVNA